MDYGDEANDGFVQYGNEEDDGVVGLVPYGFHSSTDDSIELPIKNKKRKRRVQLKNDAWYTMKNKSLRQHGKKYYGKTKEGGHWQYNKVKSARSMKKRCNCIDKGKAAIIKCGKITEPQREEIFNEFWKMSWQQKKVYVRTLIQCIKPKRPRNRAIENVSKRKKTLWYHLRVNNIVLRVCRTLFLNTLSIGRHNCLNWLDTPLVHHIFQEKQQPHTERVQDLHSFFDSIPSTDSHYCRSSTTKKYLLPEWRSKRSLYDFYKEQWCHERETDPVSITTFNSVFKLKNLSLFLPKKDLCEICSRHNVQNYSNEEFLIHQEKKMKPENKKQKIKMKSPMFLLLICNPF